MVSHLLLLLVRVAARRGFLLVCALLHQHRGRSHASCAAAHAIDRCADRARAVHHHMARGARRRHRHRHLMGHGLATRWRLVEHLGALHAAVGGNDGRSLRCEDGELRPGRRRRGGGARRHGAAKLARHPTASGEHAAHGRWHRRRQLRRRLGHMRLGAGEGLRRHRRRRPCAAAGARGRLPPRSSR